jgi:hypothetical protein
VRRIEWPSCQAESQTLRNYLRPFRGVSKWCLDSDLAFYQGMHNYRRDVLGFLRKLLRPITPEGT